MIRTKRLASDRVKLELLTAIPDMLAEIDFDEVGGFESALELTSGEMMIVQIRRDDPTLRRREVEA